MNGLKRSKINLLLMRWAKSTLATSGWLGTQGVYRQLANTYAKSGWIERVGRGAFKRAGDEADWTGALYALQTQLHLSVHAAGKTALQMQGYAHYLPLGFASRAGSASGSKYASVSESASGAQYASLSRSGNKSYPHAVLFGHSDEKLPAWFKQHPWKAKIQYTMTRLFGDEDNLGLTDHDRGDYSIKIASPERAMLEVCYDVPDKESFEEAGHLMEGLTTLRPALVQGLLEKCHSVKAKRLFMYFAEEQNHAWVKKLNLAKVDFGSGKRSLARGGHYNKKYQIVVPNKATTE